MGCEHVCTGYALMGPTLAAHIAGRRAPRGNFFGASCHVAALVTCLPVPTR